MALLIKFHRYEPVRVGVHDEIECRWTVFDRDGRRIVQLVTDGRPNRQFPGKASQILQLDQNSAAELVAVLMSCFPDMSTDRP